MGALDDLTSKANDKLQGKGSFKRGGFQGLTDLITGAPQGLVNFASDIGEDLQGIAKLPSAGLTVGLANLGLSGDQAQSVGNLLGNTALKMSPGGGLLSAAGEVQSLKDGRAGSNALTDSDEIVKAVTTPGAKPGDVAREFLPASTATLESVGRTGQRIGGTAASLGTLGRYGDNAYIEAFKRGELAPVLAEDVANVSLIGGVASKGLTAAAESATSQAGRAAGLPVAERAGLGGAIDRTVGSRLAPYAPKLESAATTMGNFEQASNRIASMPVTLPFEMVKGGAKLANMTETGARAVGRVEGLIDQGQRSLADWRIRRQAGGVVEAARRAPEAAELRLQSEEFKSGLELPLPEQEAAMALRNQVFSPASLGPVRTILERAPDEGNALLSQYGMTPEGFSTLERYATKADPELNLRVDQALESARPAFDAAETRYTTGFGSTREATPEAQAQWAENVGDDYLWNHIDNDPTVAPLREAAEAAKADPSIDTAAAQKAYEQARDAAKDNIEYAPAKYRPALEAQREIVDHLDAVAAEVEKAAGPEAAAAIRAQTADIPTTLEALQEQGVTPEYTAGGFVKDGDASQFRSKDLRQGKVGSEKMREGTASPLNFKEQGELLLEDLRQRAKNDAFQTVAAEWGTTAADAGVRSVTEAKAQGLLAVDRTGKPVERITQDTILVPEAIQKAMRDTENVANQVSDTGRPTGLAKAARLNDKAAAGIKRFWLPLKPSWLVGDTVGNYLMAASEIGPTRAAEYLGGKGIKATREFGKEGAMLQELRTGGVKAATEAGADAGMVRVMGHGFSNDLYDFLRDPETKPRNAASRGFNKLTEASYAANNFVDNAGHAAVYLSKVDSDFARLSELNTKLSEGRITKGAYEKLTEGLTPKEIQERAVKSSLRAAGDFQNMTGVERNAVRRAAWFYPWYRHITKLVFSMPVNHPFRTAWTLHLSDQFGADPTSRPEWLRGAIDVGGGRFLRPQGLFPFPTGAPENSPLLSPQSAAASLTPVIQWPMALTGNNIGRGRPFSFAPGYGPKDSEGRPTTGFVGFDAAKNYLINQFPQGRLATDMLNPVAKYDSGQAIKSNGREIPYSTLGGPLAPLGSYLTGVSIDEPKLKEAEARAKKRAKANAKMRRNYQS